MFVIKVKYETNVTGIYHYEEISTTDDNSNEEYSSMLYKWFKIICGDTNKHYSNLDGVYISNENVMIDLINNHLTILNKYVTGEQYRTFTITMEKNKIL